MKRKPSKSHARLSCVLRNGLHHPRYIVSYSIYTFYYIIFSGKFQGVRPPERLIPGGRGYALDAILLFEVEEHTRTDTAKNENDDNHD